VQLLSDIITYVRRIIKSPSGAQITDDLIIDYINRFWINDVDARMQLFDLKTKYQFLTTPGVDQYNMPLYSVQNETLGTIGMYPVYQGFLNPGYINGIQVPLQTQKHSFFSLYPNIVQSFQHVGVGNGTAGPYTLQLPILPTNFPPNPPFNMLLRGHVDMSGIIATNTNQDPPLSAGGALNTLIPVTSTYAAVYIDSIGANGANVVISDSGQFLENSQNNGLLIAPGPAPFGNASLLDGGGLGHVYDVNQNTINYLTGQINNLYFSDNLGNPIIIPAGNNINVNCNFFQSGLPRTILYYNNVITFRTIPAIAYTVELDAYLTPAALLNTTQAIPFGYMAEYLARGAARKILSDIGDVDQFMFYEPLFKEQETLVWKRSQRQFTTNRTETIYSQGQSGGYGYNNYGLGSGTL
jgi:hypothetical protein